MRYALSRFEEYRVEMAYRFYVTDCLQIMNKNMVQFVGGSIVEKRFFDVINSKVIRTNKTEEEIISAVRNALRKAVEDGTV